MYNYPVFASPFNQPQNQLTLLYRTQDLQQYNNPEFLFRTFNNKSDYIEAFLALDHPTKLQFYLLLEEARLTGTMSNKTAYQNILNMIARAVQILKGSSLNTNSQHRQTMEDKINQLCEYQFKKLQIYDQTNHESQPSSNPANNDQEFGDYNTQNDKQKSDQKKKQQDIWEWGNNNTEQVEQFSPFVQNINSIPITNNFNTSIQNLNISNVPTFDQLYPKPKTQFKQQPQIIPKFALSLFENNGEEESYKVNIFDILVDEEQQGKQNNNNLLNIQIIPHPTQSTSEEQFNQFIDAQPSKLLQSNQKTQINFDEIYKNKIIVNSFQPQLKPQKPEIIIPPVQEKDNYGFQLMNLDILASTQIFKQPIKNISSDNYSNQNSFLIEVDYISNQKQQKQDINQMEIIKEDQKDTQQWGQYQDNNQQCDSQHFNDINLAEQTRIQSQNQKSNQNNQIVILSSSHQNEYQSYHLEQSNKISFSQKVPQSYIMPKSTINPIIYKNKPSIDHPLLQPLILQFDTSNIKQKIKRNTYQCDEQFYQTIIKWIRQMQYGGGQDEDHLIGQVKLIKQIRQLTQMYTKQDQEEKVQQALRSSKQLYQKLNPLKTKTIIQYYLNKNNKTLSYQFAELAINLGVSIQLIQKNRSRCKREDFLITVCALILLQIYNSLDVIPEYTQKLTVYFLQQYEKYRQLGEKLKLMKENQQQQITSSIIYCNYLNQLSIIATICKRMVSIMKLSSKSSNSNLVKVLKACKQIESITSDKQNSKTLIMLWENNESQRLVTQSYRNRIQQSLKSKQSNEFIQQNIKNICINDNPLCKLCLGSLSLKQYQKSMIHTQCLNLYKIVNQKIQ